MEHRAADDAAARDHRLAEAAILREATVASMVAKQTSKVKVPTAPTEAKMDDGDGMDGRGIKVRHRDVYRKTGSSNRKQGKDRKPQLQLLHSHRGGGHHEIHFQRSANLQTSRAATTPCLDPDNALLLPAALPGTIS